MNPLDGYAAVLFASSCKNPDREYIMEQYAARKDFVPPDVLREQLDDEYTSRLDDRR